jgi:hypothetical protein
MENFQPYTPEELASLAETNPLYLERLINRCSRYVERSEEIDADRDRRAKIIAFRDRLRDAIDATVAR